MLQVLRVSATYVEKKGSLTGMNHSVGIYLPDVCTKPQSSCCQWSTVCSWSVVLPQMCGIITQILVTFNGVSDSLLKPSLTSGVHQINL